MRYKKRSIGIRERRYVCDPNEIHIVAKSATTANRRVTIILYVNNKEAISSLYSIDTLESGEINNNVAIFCNEVTKLKDDLIYKWVASDKVAVARYAVKKLKEARAKSGLLVWRK